MRYFFHLVDGDRDADHEGVDLPNDEAAKAEAVSYAGQLLQTNPKGLWLHSQWRVEVTDETGALRWMVLSMAIDAPLPGDQAEPRGQSAFGGA